MKKTIFAVSALGLALGAVPALADDMPPTAEQRSAIETALKSAGFATWEEIEMDDGLWEVDDARKAGSMVEYDLKMDPKTMAIVSTHQED